MAGRILGIDLGTTNSVTAVIDGGTPRVLPTSSGRLLPSVVGVSPQGELLVGTPARNQWVVAPHNTVRSIKRKMGSPATVAMAGRSYTPQEVSALILKDLKAGAEAALGESISRAVITVPAYFNELQRQATAEAGEIAGLSVERVLNEPTAAALAYGLGSEASLSDASLKVLVYDLGGGTFDVSVIELMDGVLDVRATAGDNGLGGDDFDLLLAERLADAFADAHGVDPRQDARAWARLLRAAEEAKIALSDAPFAAVALEYLVEDASGTPLSLEREVARDELEALLEGELRRTLGLVDQALEDAELRPDELDRVLLVGGSTRIPLVRELLAAHLGREPSGGIDPDTVVALGAAVQAGIIAGDEIGTILVDVTPLSLGIETAHVGLGGELQPDRFAPLIRRNTTIPVRKSEVFSTLYPGQDKIHIKVYQGEDEVASRNTPLGDFMVEGVTPEWGSGLAEVTVDFDLDVSGILEVSVAERSGRARASAQLKASRQRLSAAEIAASQIKLSAPHAALSEGDGVTDALDDATAALLTRAEAVLGEAELSGEEASALAGLMADLREAARSGDVRRLERLSDQLVDTLMEVE